MKRNKHFYKRNGYSKYPENIPPEISINHNTWYFKKKTVIKNKKFLGISRKIL